MQQNRYLVFGATGQQGGAVARALRQNGQSVRAFVRNTTSDKARALEASGINVVQGDLFDHASIARAMQGITGVFSVQTSSPGGEVSDAQEVAQGKAIADAAIAANVQHIVYSSGGAAGKGATGMGHFDSKSEIERYLRSLPIASTITRPASFMEMMMLPGMGLPEGRFTFFMHPHQAMQMIALVDLGRINAAIMTNPSRYAGRDIELASDGVTGLDLQAAFSEAAGKPIVYQRFSDELLASNPFLRQLTELLDSGVLAGVADIPALEAEFGPMTKLRTWLMGPGRPLFEAALGTPPASVKLR